MAIYITEECINCGACEPECPNTAIYEGGVDWELAGKTYGEGDAAPSGAEGRLMTLAVNCEFSGLDGYGLHSRSYPGLESTRNQTLPMRSPICGYRAKTALP